MLRQSLTGVSSDPTPISKPSEATQAATPDLGIPFEIRQHRVSIEQTAERSSPEQLSSSVDSAQSKYSASGNEQENDLMFDMDGCKNKSPESSTAAADSAVTSAFTGILTPSHSSLLNTPKSPSLEQDKFAGKLYVTSPASHTSSLSSRHTAATSQDELTGIPHTNSPATQSSTLSPRHIASPAQDQLTSQPQATSILSRSSPLNTQHSRAASPKALMFEFDEDDSLYQRRPSL